jgi:cysteinyl-tRNA synthetase
MCFARRYRGKARTLQASWWPASREEVALSSYAITILIIQARIQSYMDLWWTSAAWSAFSSTPTKAAGSDAVADKAIQVLIAVRQQLRKKKDFETADLLRNMLAERKITLEDRPDGTIWRAH